VNTATAGPTEASPEALLARVQELQSAVESAGESPPPELLEALLSSVVQMYGAGLERILAALAADGEDGRRIAAGLTEDPLVATLLLVHDLHPVPLADRVQAALDSVRPYMESHGGNVELLSLEHGVARIHLRGSCSSCSASSVTLELAIKQALEEAAPDLAGLEVEGMEPEIVGGIALPMVPNSGTGGPVPADPGHGSIELPIAASGPVTAPSWFELESFGELEVGALAAVAVAGRELVIANVEGTLLAYRNSCAGCGAPLQEGTLRAGALTCPRCARSFSLPRAGRSLGDDGIQLEPVPLLRQQESVKVALAV
jgi:Fe-S cluster biogenesis protein NfuA/nitrite reductase/ring-hydroxylating ferredoxin subunit